MKIKIGEYFIKGAAFAAGATFFIGVGVLFADSINSFSSGDSISSAKINANFQISAPQGFIGAFYLSSCPTGWVAADGTNSTPDLRGQFLRGMNTFGSAAGTRADGNEDPNGGARTLGDYQADAFQGHRHTYTLYNVTNEFVMNGVNPISVDHTHTATTNDPVTDGTNGTPRISNETRVKNVALIFCMRKDT